jgi:hypothetical protein
MDACDGYAAAGNACVECGVELGAANPRQYCHKTFCPQRMQYDGLADALHDGAARMTALRARIGAHMAAAWSGGGGGGPNRAEMSRAEVMTASRALEDARADCVRAERAMRALVAQYAALR